MAVSVIDTRGEFKLIPYSGDDEQWPQWVLKFEAWSEFVGWGQHLDNASQSTHPIVNSTLQVEVQSISRQLYAILVVKLEGKALGIVHLVTKGEGLEAWRQLKLEYEGKSGNRQAALLWRNLNPRPGWETDARDGRSLVESLNRWEKTLSLYRKASGEDISDGILAATVLEHSPESYQNILKQAPSNVRASYGAMRGWLRENAETLGTMEPLGLLQFNHSRLVRCQWRSIRHEQCRVSRLEKTGRANPKEGARPRMVRARAGERNAKRSRIRNHKPRLNSSKDTVDTARDGDTSVLTAENVSLMVSRRVVRQQPVLTTTVMFQL